MNRIQRGATLLEAILAAAVVGIIMAYTGRQALFYAERRMMEEQAETIVDSIKSYRDFITSPTLKLSEPVSGRDYLVNDFWKLPEVRDSAVIDYEPSWGLVGSKLFSPTLADFKLATCTRDGGKLNQNVIDPLIECGKFDVVSPLKHYGMEVYVTDYSSIVYPEMFSRPVGIEVLYVLEESADLDQMMQVAIRIPDVKSEEGFRIRAEDIDVTDFRRAAGAGEELFEPIRSEYSFNMDDFLAGDFEKFNTFRERAIREKWTVGITIRFDFKDVQDLLKADGSIPLEEEAKLCWSDGTNDNLPCIGAMFDPEDMEQNAILIQNNLKVDGDLVYRDGNGDLRTPVIARYNTFTPGVVNRITYIDCPFDMEGEPLTEQIALVPSSLSTATEESTNFTDPSSIVSTGTKGASGKHAFTSGFSLEWTADNINRNWIVEGAIGIDAAYQASNDNKSVVRNPRAMSFISLQWCE